MSRVVVINSLSFTGTTWLNTVLGCHERAFALGPSDRALRLCKEGKDRDKICLVHGNSCDFWPGFVRNYKSSGNFFTQLVKASGKDTIITNNPIPDKAGIELRSSKLDVIQVNLIRDGRALLASYLRKFPDVAAIDAIATFLYPSFHQFYFDESNPDILCLRYEDVLTRPEEALKRIGSALGIEYSLSALRFWEYSQHLTTGNQGTIACIKLGQGIDVSNFKDREFYQQQFELLQAGRTESFSDNRWRTELSRRELFLFDLLCGDENQHFGYTRDQFSLDEVSVFAEEIKEAMKGKSLPANISELIDQKTHSLFGGISAKSSKQAQARMVFSSVKQQLSVEWIKKYGIMLTPQQIKKLIPYAIVAVLGTSISIVLFSVLLCRLF